jgi:hypothetical protein
MRVSELLAAGCSRSQVAVFSRCESSMTGIQATNARRTEEAYEGPPKRRRRAASSDSPGALARPQEVVDTDCTRQHLHKKQSMQDGEQVAIQ